MYTTQHNNTHAKHEPLVAIHFFLAPFSCCQSYIIVPSTLGTSPIIMERKRARTKTEGVNWYILRQGVYSETSLPRKLRLKAAISEALSVNARYYLRGASHSLVTRDRESLLLYRRCVCRLWCRPFPWTPEDTTRRYNLA